MFVRKTKSENKKKTNKYRNNLLQFQFQFPLILLEKKKRYLFISFFVLFILISYVKQYFLLQKHKKILQGIHLHAYLSQCKRSEHTAAYTSFSDKTRI